MCNAERDIVCLQIRESHSFLVKRTLKIWRRMGRVWGRRHRENTDTEQEEDDANNDDENDEDEAPIAKKTRKSATKRHKGETVSEIIPVFIDLI